MRRPFSSEHARDSASLNPPMPPSRASTALSAMSTFTTSTNSSCKSHCYDPYLMPDTFTLPTPPTPGVVAAPQHHPSALDKSTPLSSADSSRKSSSWDMYLLETQRHHSELDTDRRRMRASLLASMKTYYGNSKWERVPAIGDDTVEYVADEPKYQDYTDQIVLFGEDRNFIRRKFMDRRGYTVPTKEFDIVKVDAEGRPRPGLVKRMTSRIKR